MKRPAISPGSLVLASAAGLLTLFLVVGWILPGTWAAERSAVLDLPPDTLYPWVDSPGGWQRWTPWPDSGVVREGPERGVGARLAWDDEELGEGSFEIVEAVPDSLVRYRVVVQGGAMHTDGTLRLRSDGSGTRVEWREEGDFGKNPLMGYWARFMAHAQGAELEKALRRLGEVAARGHEEASADSTRADASLQAIGPATRRGARTAAAPTR
jgi:hypothetical protein